MFRFHFSMPPARAACMLLLGCASLFGADLAHAVSPSDFKWDLTYRSALEHQPIPADEFMRTWVTRLAPERPIVAAMKAYAGAAVEGAVLIEKPDGHTGDPLATWFIRTAGGASVCTYHRQIAEKCQPADPVRMDQFMHDVMHFPQLRPQTGKTLSEKGEDGKPIQLNYLGFLSVYVDGVALQRPIALTESTETDTGVDPQAGRLERAVARLVLSPEDARQREVWMQDQLRRQQLNAAAVGGDPSQLRKLLDAPGGAGADLVSALALAAANGRHRAVDLLLERGARIDGDESAALKAAVRAGDEEMVRHLLERGAHADPQRTGKPIHQSALALAVELHNAKLARLLIERGADLNLAQSRPVLTTAVMGVDPAMVELLLSAGAKPWGSGADDAETPLMVLVGQAGKQDGPRTEADRARIVRQLLDAGASIDTITSRCTTAYSESVRVGAASMTALLQTLGADPELHARCEQKKEVANKGSSDGAEGRARSAISNAVEGALRTHDYAKLDALYASVKDARQVTPAGRSKLGIFYYSLRTFPTSTRDPEYWRTMQAEAASWKAKSPRSIPARMYEVYLHQRRTEAFRGNGYYNTLTADERREVSAASAAAERALIAAKPAMTTARDPEWYRAMLGMLPYSNWFRPVTMMNYLREGAERYPGYEDLYFTAAWYLVPDYTAQPDARDIVARYAGARKEKNAAGLYARVYWYLDQMDYHGTLFEQGFADWPTMRASFADMVAQYPDPWNLNAYAYFACKAGDYATMAELLNRIGKDVVAISWNGADTYSACSQHAAQGDAAERARFEAAQPQVRQKRLARVFFDFIRFASRMRNSGELETSLAALRRAEDVDRELGRRPSMMAQYHKGMTLAKMKRHEEAIEAYTLGLRAQPGYVEAFWRRGQSQAALGRQEEARQDYGTAAKLFAQHPPASLAALNEEGRADVREMQRTFREAGFETPTLQ